MSPLLRGSNTILKSGDGLWELKDFIDEQLIDEQLDVPTQDRKIFRDALRAQRNGDDSQALNYYSQLSNRYNSQVILDNINELI